MGFTEFQLIYKLYLSQFAQFPRMMHNLNVYCSNLG